MFEGGVDTSSLTEAKNAPRENVAGPEPEIIRKSLHRANNTLKT